MSARDELYVALRAAGEERSEVGRLLAAFRAEVLRGAADVLDTLPADASGFDRAEHKYKGGAAAADLRRMADEAGESRA
ncbi:hypothetical protein ACZ90_30535 [Streptomyces albus subsp. albus]|nr:hypothetical protein ACZ90_30535 [Streptomyces albus subsp. albus]